MDFNTQRHVTSSSNQDIDLTDHFDAILIVDSQEKYAKHVAGHDFYWGTHETEAVAAHIGRLSKIFRDAGVPIYAAYYAHENIPTESETAPEDIDFYGYEYHDGDILIRKTENSAFNGTDFDRTLAYNKHKKILVLGFNASACIQDTVADALNHRLSCWVLTDGVGNGIQQDDKQRAEGMTYMNMEGARFIISDDALKTLGTAIDTIKLQIPELTAEEAQQDEQRRTMIKLLNFQR